MIKHYILIHGKPVAEPDFLKAARWLESIENRRLAQSIVGGVTVSTVFLGIDHSFGGGVPILWETMIFGGELDGEQERYTSQTGAKLGHAEWVAKVTAAQAK